LVRIIVLHHQRVLRVLSRHQISNGRTAIPVASYRINSLFQMIHPAAAASATRTPQSALVGLRCIHFLPRAKIQYAAPEWFVL
jgi:hypothetical protein